MHQDESAGAHESLQAINWTSNDIKLNQEKILRKNTEKLNRTETSDHVWSDWNLTSDD